MGKMATAIPASAGEQKRAALALKEALGRFITSTIEMDRLVSSSSAGVIIEGQTRLSRNQMQTISDLCRFLGIDPAATFRAVVEELASVMKTSEFFHWLETGETKAPKDAKENRMLLQRALDFPPPSPDWFGKTMKIIQARVLDRNIYVMGLGEPKRVSPDEWFRQKPLDIDPIVQKLIPPEFITSAVCVPLLCGRSVSIRIHYSGKINMFEFDPSDALFGSKSLTYPAANPFLAKSNLREHSNGTYLFRTAYATEAASLGRYGGMEQFGSLTSQNIEVKPHLKTKFRMEPALAGSILRILDRRILQASHVETVLKRLMKFIGDRGKGEDAGIHARESFPRLLKLFEKNGAFPADCKSISTITAGLANFLGFAARRLAGSVQFIEEGRDTGGGHVWTEVYIPETHSWIPVDAAGANAFKAYPDKTSLYVPFGYLPEFKGTQKNARVMVSYE